MAPSSETLNTSTGTTRDGATMNPPILRSNGDYPSAEHEWEAIVDVVLPGAAIPCSQWTNSLRMER